jgi:hypothetical protein
MPSVSGKEQQNLKPFWRLIGNAHLGGTSYYIRFENLGRLKHSHNYSGFEESKDCNTGLKAGCAQT